MIRTFADTETERFYITGKSRRFPPDVLKRAVKRLTQIDAATVVQVPISIFYWETFCARMGPSVSDRMHFLGEVAGFRG
jgi:plasmid maintenance system killer protein